MKVKKRTLNVANDEVVLVFRRYRAEDGEERGTIFGLKPNDEELISMQVDEVMDVIGEMHHIFSHRMDEIKLRVLDKETGKEVPHEKS